MPQFTNKRVPDVILDTDHAPKRPLTPDDLLSGFQASVQAEFYSDKVTGHKFALQIVTDVPHFGGASGSSLEEAQSWGKLSFESEKVTVHGDVTLALPLLDAMSVRAGSVHSARPGGEEAVLMNISMPPLAPDDQLGAEAQITETASMRLPGPDSDVDD